MKRIIGRKSTDKILKDIYIKSGEMPDFHHIEIKKEKRLRKILILLIIFFASMAAAAWAGFFVFKPYQKFSGKEVKFEIRGPQTIIAGEETDFDIVVRNEGDAPIAETSVFLILPPEFSLIKSEPSFQEPNRWFLGMLEPGDKHIITLKGIIIKSIQEDFVLNATLNYRPANFNSEFQNVASFKANVNSSILETAIESPAESDVGEEVNFKIKYRNSGTVRTDNLCLHIIFPEHFIFTTSTRPFNENNEILIDKLEPGEEGSLEIKGSFSTSASDLEKLISQIGFLRNDKFILQQESEISISLKGSDLLLELSINGGDTKPLSFGDPVYGAIKFKNVSNKVLQGITISAVFESSPTKNGKDLIKWETFKEPFGAKKQHPKVSWDSSSVFILNELNPQDEGNLDFSFNLIDNPFTLENRDYKISFYLEASIAKINGRKVDKQLQSQKITIPLKTDLSFKAYGRYFDEDNIALGTGPLPPKVGEQTTYRIFWIIKNSLHDLKDVTIRAKLPRNVSFGPRSLFSVGTLSHTEDEVIWKIDNLPSLISQAEASFDVGVIPQLGDVGLALNLLGESEITAKDANLDVTINLTQPAITTEIPEDEEGRGKGTTAP